MKKPFWKSTTIQGIALAAAGVLTKYAVTKGWIGTDLSASIGDLLDYIAGAMQLSGLGLAVYGRARTGGEKLGVSKSQ